MRLLREFWNDELGAVLSAEMVSVGTVAVLGTTVGLGALRDSVNEELVDTAKAIRSMDQSYSIPGRSGGGAWTAGSSFKQRPVAESLASIGLTPTNAESAAPATKTPMKPVTPSNTTTNPNSTKTYEGTQLELVPQLPPAPAPAAEPVTVTPAEKKLNPKKN